MEYSEVYMLPKIFYFFLPSSYTPNQTLLMVKKNKMASHSPRPFFDYRLFSMTDSELEFDLNKAIIAVHFYAESERDIDPSQRLTYSHIAAIHRHQISVLPTDTLANIDGDMIQSNAISITCKINDINKAKADIAADITQMGHNLHSLIYNNLLSEYPGLSNEDFENDLDNLEFFDSLERSPAYEKNYLQVVRSKYAAVPDEMKEGLGLENLGIQTVT